MRRLAVLGICVLLVGCDPGRAVSYVVRTPGPAPMPDSVSRALSAIAGTLADRYRLESDGEAERPRCFVRNHDIDPAPERDHTVTLRFCERLATGGGVELRLHEYFTTRWSPIADSLRSDLAATLGARFGAWVVER